MNKEGSIPNVRALLLVGALYAEEEHYLKAKERLAGMFGPIVMETAPRAWDHTDHYKEELGPDILRRFLFFENTVNQNELAEIKIKTNSLEEELSTGGKRNVNLDPGYMTMAKLVLASTKDYVRQTAFCFVAPARAWLCRHSGRGLTSMPPASPEGGSTRVWPA